MPILSERIKESIRDVPEFPKTGIVFKDITPVLSNPRLSADILESLKQISAATRPDAIVALESRGFWFGPALAMALGLPFIPVRKLGKLPYETIQENYQLEYGSATLEMHIDALAPGSRVLIHDDLLATGGTAAAAARLVERQGSIVCAFCFLIELTFLKGRSVLTPHSPEIATLLQY